MRERIILWPLAMDRALDHRYRDKQSRRAYKLGVADALRFERFGDPFAECDAPRPGRLEYPEELLEKYLRHVALSESHEWLMDELTDLATRLDRDFTPAELAELRRLAGGGE